MTSHTEMTNDDTGGIAARLCTTTQTRALPLREREREGERETDRQTDWQKDSETDISKYCRILKWNNIVALTVNFRLMYTNEKVWMLARTKFTLLYPD